MFWHMALIALSSVPMAQEEMETENDQSFLGFERLSVEVYSDIWTQYLIPQGIVASEEVVIQSGVTLGWKNGVFLDFMHSAGLESGLHSDFDDELDMEVGWVEDLGKKVEVEVGISYLNLFPLDKGDRIDLLSPSVELKKTFGLGHGHALAPFGKVQAFWTMDEPSPKERLVRTADGSTMTAAGLRHDWKSDGGYWSAKQELAVIYDSGLLTALEDGFVVFYETAINCRLSDSITFKPLAFKMTVPASDFSDGRGTEMAFGVGLNVDF